MLALLAQQTQQQNSAPGGLLGMFAPMALIFAVFYFLIIRPQQKQQKKIQVQINSMKKGDQVVTRSGIHGKIAQLDDGTVMLEIAQNVQIKMNKDQVAAVKPAA